MKLIGQKTQMIVDEPDHEILRLFSAPLYKTHIGINNDEKEILMGEKKWVGQEDNILIQSESDQILNLDGIERIKNEINKHIKKYIKSIISPLEDDTEFIITQSWLNIINDGFHHKHRHQNSIISGAFYVNTTMKDFIEFDSPLAPFWDMLSVSSKELNEFNSVNYREFVHSGQLVIFPSYLTHGVPGRFKTKGIKSQPRCSLAFNTFPVGRLGGSHEQHPGVNTKKIIEERLTIKLGAQHQRNEVKIDSSKSS